ncbi:Ig-like domain-containing protein [Acerihabitans arboris]|uniref:Big-1 domain-containing protein n=1 Tax=Acerihabitans arboris TaxID=2691583 RepID=A0A845SQU5_9GAMM|nr:Ig-like domain-containing protein [Acerihabitans arboris]NDL65732.1 hypothetical protein [Acerihabitans arboris]
MHNHYLPEPYSPIPFALPAMNLVATSGAPANDIATNEVTATLIDLLTGNYITNATIDFNVTGDALFEGNRQSTTSAMTNNNGVASVWLTSTQVETVTVVATYDSVRQQAYISFTEVPVTYPILLERSSAPALADFDDTIYLTGRLAYNGQPAPNDDYAWIYFTDPIGATASTVVRVIGNSGEFSYAMHRYIPGTYLAEVEWRVNEAVTLRSNILPVEFLARHSNQPYRIDFFRNDEVELPNIRTVYLTMALRYAGNNAIIPNQTLEITRIYPEPGFFATVPTGPDGSGIYVFPPDFLLYASFRVTWVENPTISAIYFLWTYDVQP